MTNVVRRRYLFLMLEIPMLCFFLFLFRFVVNLFNGDAARPVMRFYMVGGCPSRGRRRPRMIALRADVSPQAIAAEEWPLHYRPAALLMAHPLCHFRLRLTFFDWTRRFFGPILAVFRSLWSTSFPIRAAAPRLLIMIARDLPRSVRRLISFGFPWKALYSAL